MSEVTIRIWADTENEADRSSAAKELESAFRNKAPGVTLQHLRSNPHGQAVFDILMVAVTHVTVMVVIESIRLGWEIVHQPVKVELPGGGVYTFKGNTQELQKILGGAVGGQAHGSSTDGHSA